MMKLHPKIDKLVKYVNTLKDYQLFKREEQRYLFIQMEYYKVGFQLNVREEVCIVC